MRMKQSKVSGIVDLSEWNFLDGKDTEKLEDAFNKLVGSIATNTILAVFEEDGIGIGVSSEGDKIEVEVLIPLGKYTGSIEYDAVYSVDLEKFLIGSIEDIADALEPLDPFIAILERTLKQAKEQKKEYEED